MHESTVPSNAIREQLLERSRRCVLGHLCPMILHETNNVLTVLSGIRQLLKLGKEMSDRIGPMIDGQLEKMEDLLSWIRGMEEEEPGAPTRTVATLCHTMDRVVSLGAKGRRHRSEAHGTEDALTGTSIEVASLTMMCAMLPLIPPRAPGAQLVTTFDGRVEQGRLVVRSSFEPVHVSLRDQPDIELATDLARSFDGRLTLSDTDVGGHAELQLDLPCDLRR